MGFGIRKEELVKNLEIIRKNLCCYMIPDSCDCKYNPELHSNKLNENILLTEHTGCPEIRQIIDLLLVMKDEYFYKLCRKARIIIT